MNNIHWSPLALSQLEHELDYWTRHNLSRSYSRQILRAVSEAVGRLQLLPYIGPEIHYRGVIVRRLVILRRFSLLYFVTRSSSIEIFAFLDNTRQADF